MGRGWGGSSRDPVEEKDSANIYNCLENSLANQIDFIGLADVAFILGPNLAYTRPVNKRICLLQEFLANAVITHQGQMMANDLQ